MRRWSGGRGCLATGKKGKPEENLRKSKQTEVPAKQGKARQSKRQPAAEGAKGQFLKPGKNSYAWAAYLGKNET